MNDLDIKGLRTLKIMGSIDKIMFVLYVHYCDFLFLVAIGLLPILFQMALKQVEFVFLVLVEKVIVDRLEVK